MNANDLQALCLELAPELRPGGLRVYFASAVPALAAVRTVRGMAPPFLSAMLEPHLPPCPAVLLHDAILRAEAQEYSVDAAVPLDEGIRRVFLAVALHEVAHVLDYPPPHFTAPSVRVDPAAVAAVLERLPAAVDDAAPWAGHGPSWIRCVVHLRHRLARRVGLPLAMTQILHDSYGLGCTHSFVTALGDEPSRSEAMRFEDILAAPLPPAFARLWADRTRDFTATAAVPPVAASTPGHSPERTFHMAASTTIAPSPTPPPAKTTSRAELQALIARKPAVEAELAALADEEASLRFEELSTEQLDIRLRRIGRRRHALNDQLHAIIDAERTLFETPDREARRREVVRQCSAIERQIKEQAERIDHLQRCLISYRRDGDHVRIARAEAKIVDAQAERQRLLDEHQRLQSSWRA